MDTERSLQAFTLLVITVTSVMGIASSAVYFPAFAAYTAANLLPPVLRLVLEEARLQNTVALLLVTFAGMLLLVGRHIAKPAKPLTVASATAFVVVMACSNANSVRLSFQPL